MKKPQDRCINHTVLPPNGRNAYCAPHFVINNFINP